MVARVQTLMFQGVEARRVEVQVGLTGGLPSFNIVGLADKTVGESRERIRTALAHSGLSLPPKRITVNLSPADLAKEGSHFDLPIALGLLSALGIVEQESLSRIFALGELSLDGRLLPVPGILSAALTVHQEQGKLLCPQDNGSEAAWVKGLPILHVASLGEAIEELRNPTERPPPQPLVVQHRSVPHDYSDLKGQESAKRAIEIAAAGGHNILMIGTPGAGKSMLAERFPSILPPMTAHEVLETARIQSIAGNFLDDKEPKGPTPQRPFRAPHHSASLPALVGGGRNALPGEISLAHNGVLFLDELPEFSRQALEALRQPLESGSISVARANAHVTYPAKFQLVAAMNPCRCGYLEDPKRACRKAPLCAEDYQKRLSGPLLDRIDLFMGVQPVEPYQLQRGARGENSASIAARVLAARERQVARYLRKKHKDHPPIVCNAHVPAGDIETLVDASQEALDLLRHAASQFSLSARGYYRTLRVARTIADLQAQQEIPQQAMSEALSFRKLPLQTAALD